MSKSYRELKQTVSTLQSLLSEFDAKLREARLDANYYKAMYGMEMSRREAMEKMANEKSLIISDDAEEIRSLRETLKSRGYQVPCLYDTLSWRRENARRNPPKPITRDEYAKNMQEEQNHAN